MSEPEYVPVGRASPELNPSSPNPDSHLGSPSLLSPEGADSALLGRTGTPFRPAPSVRDSTYSSLAAPSVLVGGETRRQSWGSAAPLDPEAASEGSPRPRVSRGQSNLAHSSLGWNNTSDERFSDEDEGEGHIAPGIVPVGGPAEAAVGEKPAWAQDTSRSKGRKLLWIGLAAGGITIIALAVGLGVGLTHHHSKTLSALGSSSKDTSGGATSSSASGTHTATSSAASATATTGGQGSLITFEDGTTMTYQNTFGGRWVYDAADPFNNGAQCNSWTPALNQSWTWGIDKIQGVNIGGWLVTEPFIVPALYETYATGPNNQTAVDEFTLSQNMGSNLTAAMTEHYETFITEQDFAEIATAGLNWVRIPFPHWAISTWPGEPYLEGVAWNYFLKAIKWARKYGLRINLDLHTMPGSQNGWNHSGHLGLINWLNGVMGLANAQRGLDYIRTLAQFISQDEYSPVVMMFGFVNEPYAVAIGKNPVASFYLQAYNEIRAITGLGAGKGPFLSIHDGFIGISNWYGFLPGADRLAFDLHQYMVFQAQPQGTIAEISVTPCSWWADTMNQTSEQWGVNFAGEWSSAINDCGLWVNGVGDGTRYEGQYGGITQVTGSCDYWNDWTQWNQSTISNLQTFTLASMDALQNYFFWTWKIGNSTGSIAQVNPFWHYRLGWQEGWVPKDPRSAVGVCASIGVNDNHFGGTFSSAWMTGGSGAGTIAAAQTSSYPWPPASFTSIASASISLLPQYTQTATPITLSPPIYTSPGSSATINAGNGWANPSDDSRQAYTAISGCTYPPEYFAATLAITAGECGAGMTQPTKRAADAARPTPAPRALQ